MSDPAELLEQAKAESANQNEPQAQKILLELLRQEPHNTAALYMLGGSYFCSEKFAEAAVIFEQLVLMFPAEGKASTGFYNALWQQGKATEAVTEIKRFLESADPKLERETITAYLHIIETLSADDSRPTNQGTSE